MTTRSFATTILAALLAVLTLVSSAWAGCAWVLWRVDHDVQRTLHVAFDAYETKQQGDVERQQLAEKAADVINRGGLSRLETPSGRPRQRLRDNRPRSA
jgi:hypothetical protein